MFWTAAFLFPSQSLQTVRVYVSSPFGLGLLAFSLQSFPPPPVNPLSSALVPSVWYPLSQSWHGTSSASPRFQWAHVPQQWLPLLDNARLCLHLLLISGIPALLVTTGGWSHCLILTCSCYSIPLPPPHCTSTIHQPALLHSKTMRAFSLRLIRASWPLWWQSGA